MGSHQYTTSSHSTTLESNKSLPLLHGRVARRALRLRTLRRAAPFSTRPWPPPGRWSLKPSSTRTSSPRHPSLN